MLRHLPRLADHEKSRPVVGARPAPIRVARDLVHRQPQGLVPLRAGDQPLVKGGHEYGRTLIAHLPLAGNDRLRAGVLQRPREADQALARHPRTAPRPRSAPLGISAALPH